jgi:hypothetical protein
MNEELPTDRRFPRTTRDAFKNDLEHAQWWFPPESCWQDKLLFTAGVVLWIVVGVCLWMPR